MNINNELLKKALNEVGHDFSNDLLKISENCRDQIDKSIDNSPLTFKEINNNGRDELLIELCKQLTKKALTLRTITGIRFVSGYIDTDNCQEVVEFACDFVDVITEIAPPSAS